MDILSHTQHLRAHPDFSHGRGESSGLFVYSDAAAPELVELRRTYGLDKVAGCGDSWSRARRLAKWTFEQLFCVGANINPDPRHSLNILAHRGKGALFCLHKAIVLNEALLSVGIASRLLWCYPFAFDSDCHVVALVYLPELGKWTMLDPTFNTFFTSADGTPLSVLEVREAFTRGEVPLFEHITIQKNWTLVMNGVVCETYDEFYRLYMAKNCFRFSSPAVSRFGCSTDLGVARVFLNPAGFACRNEYDRSPAAPNANLYTDAADAFFARP